MPIINALKNPRYKRVAPDGRPIVQRHNWATGDIPGFYFMNLLHMVNMEHTQ